MKERRLIFAQFALWYSGIRCAKCVDDPVSPSGDLDRATWSRAATIASIAILSKRWKKTGKSITHTVRRTESFTRSTGDGISFRAEGSEAVINARFDQVN